MHRRGARTSPRSGYWPRTRAHTHTHTHRQELGPSISWPVVSSDRRFARISQNGKLGPTLKGTVAPHGVFLRSQSPVSERPRRPGVSVNRISARRWTLVLSSFMSCGAVRHACQQTDMATVADPRASGSAACIAVACPVWRGWTGISPSPMDGFLNAVLGPSGQRILDLYCTSWVLSMI